MSPVGKHERVNQKIRTRRALLDAAGDLIEAGQVPTVAEVADKAMVSRATAYRYYPSQDALLAEVPLGTSALPTPGALLNGPDGPSDPEDRIALAHNTLYDIISDREMHFRHYMRLALLRAIEPDGSPIRPGHRVGLIDTALEDVADEIDPEQLAYLKQALGIIIGTEAIIAMRDVLHLERDDARDVGEWAARRLVRSVLDEDRRPGAPPIAPG